MDANALSPVETRLGKIERGHRLIKIFLAAVVLLGIVLLALMFVIGYYVWEVRSRLHSVELKQIKLETLADKDNFVVKEMGLKSDDDKAGVTLRARKGANPGLQLLDDKGKVIWEAPEIKPEKDTSKKPDNPFSPDLDEGGGWLFEKKPDESSSAFNRGAIKQVGDNEFVIEKKALEDSLKNLDSMITQARAIPNFTGSGDDRKIDGFRIYRIQPGSIYELMGLMNGDVIKEINGMKLDSIDSALQLFQSLRTESDFTLIIERQGQTLKFHYKIE